MCVCVYACVRVCVCVFRDGSACLLSLDLFNAELFLTGTQILGKDVGRGSGEEGGCGGRDGGELYFTLYSH